MTTTEDLTTHTTDALVERLFGAVLAMLDLQAVYLGDRLGYCRALTDVGGLTSAELAARTGTAERYTREWLEQQAVTGILTASDEADATRRRFTLPAGHFEPLTDVLSPHHLVPMARLVVGLGKQMDALVAAFECVHDLPDPVSVLAAMRSLAGPWGIVHVMDERVAETFTAPGDEIERLMYGYSLLCCLPDGLAWHTSHPRQLEPRCDRTRCAATPSQPASPASRCSGSRTSSAVPIRYRRPSRRRSSTDRGCSTLIAATSCSPAPHGGPGDR